MVELGSLIDDGFKGGWAIANCGGKSYSVHLLLATQPHYNENLVILKESLKSDEPRYNGSQLYMKIQVAWIPCIAVF